MRSFRSKPIGWQHESHRHYLAAKGISTKKTYCADKFNYKAAADGLRSLFHDGRPDTEDYGKAMKMQQVDNLRNEVVGKLNEAQESGEITTDNAQRFMNNDFTDETKDFLHRDTESYTQYHDDVMRKLDWHLSTYSTKPRMPWTMEKKYHGT
jgi:hypothetical protein